ncbi:unnamed protein product, partial [Protopolystoma xenopodis]
APFQVQAVRSLPGACDSPWRAPLHVLRSGYTRPLQRILNPGLGQPTGATRCLRARHSVRFCALLHLSLLIGIFCRLFVHLQSELSSSRPTLAAPPTAASHRGCQASTTRLLSTSSRHEATVESAVHVSPLFARGCLANGSVIESDSTYARQTRKSTVWPTCPARNDRIQDGDCRRTQIEGERTTIRGESIMSLRAQPIVDSAESVSNTSSSHGIPAGGSRTNYQSLQQRETSASRNRCNHGDFKKPEIKTGNLFSPFFSLLPAVEAPDPDAICPPEHPLSCIECRSDKHRFCDDPFNATALKHRLVGTVECLGFCVKWIRRPLNAPGKL